MNISLEGKSALITGASRGIGLAIARRFAEAGSELHLVARDKSNLEEISEELRTSGYGVACHAADLATSVGIASLPEAFLGADILVNNAGSIPSGSVDEVDDAAWRAAWDLKVFGYINLTRALLARMYARRSGVVVNVIGMGGVAHDYDYICGSTANAALIAFTNALGSRSTDRGVRVIGINPSAARTTRIEQMARARAGARLNDPERWRELLSDLPFGRLLEPDEVARMALFLASDQASYASGTVFNLDGGKMYR
jgi:NAD(P)-dependent dehydrogenase (short-subunit alcohol dehydrogenase family)